LVVWKLLVDIDLSLQVNRHNLVYMHLIGVLQRKWFLIGYCTVFTEYDFAAVHSCLNFHRGNMMVLISVTFEMNAALSVASYCNSFGNHSSNWWGMWNDYLDDTFIVMCIDCNLL